MGILLVERHDKNEITARAKLKRNITGKNSVTRSASFSRADGISTQHLHSAINKKF